MTMAAIMIQKLVKRTPSNNSPFFPNTKEIEKKCHSRNYDHFQYTLDNEHKKEANIKKDGRRTITL